jgi:hypothetical protein
MPGVRVVGLFEDAAHLVVTDDAARAFEELGVREMDRGHAVLEAVLRGDIRPEREQRIGVGVKPLPTRL